MSKFILYKQPLSAWICARKFSGHNISFAYARFATERTDFTVLNQICTKFPAAFHSTTPWMSFCFAHCHWMLIERKPLSSWQQVGGVIMDDCYKTALCLIWTQCSPGYNSGATVTTMTVVWRLVVKRQCLSVLSMLAVYQALLKTYTWLFINQTDRYLLSLRLCVVWMLVWLGIIACASVFIQY